jgi:hypothetical protein
MKFSYIEVNTPQEATIFTHYFIQDNRTKEKKITKLYTQTVG